MVSAGIFMNITAYVDFSILDTLASSPPEKSKQFPHWQSMRAIWRKFIDNNIRLVTSGMDLEMDIILWLLHYRYNEGDGGCG